MIHLPLTPDSSVRATWKIWGGLVPCLIPWRWGRKAEEDFTEAKTGGRTPLIE